MDRASQFSTMLIPGIHWQWRWEIPRNLTKNVIYLTISVTSAGSLSKALTTWGAKQTRQTS